MYFSGTLTLNLDPADLTDGQQILLYQFPFSDGNFSAVTVDAGDCSVEGDLYHDNYELVFRIDIILCSSLAGARLTW